MPAVTEPDGSVIVSAQDKPGERDVEHDPDKLIPVYITPPTNQFAELKVNTSVPVLRTFNTRLVNVSQL